MPTFSQQETYLTSSQIEAITSCSGTGVNLNDINLSSLTTTSLSSLTTTDTITISGGGGAGSSYYYATGASGAVGSSINTISVSGGSYTIGNISNVGIQITMPEEFVNTFPDFDRIKKMCEEYPGLKIAYEKFVTTYKLVKDHYDTPESERPRI